ncbi:MAG: phosphoribosyltransferase [Flavobacteriales bacterium]|nr:phosphoribosyltransferase [Flavobacteriales bacterium]
MNKTLVLTKDQMKQKLQRMAWEIYEQNHSEDSIIVAGIAKRGFVLAEEIAKTLANISLIKVKLVSVNLDKDNPLDTPIQVDKVDFTNQTVVLVDDVLKSGKTLMYGAQYFMQKPLKKLTTAVLIDRNYKHYPIKVDVVGLSLSTTMQEHVSVELGKKKAVYLQ